MTLDEIIEQRRSVRSFESTPVDREDLLTICEAARLAPSACNSQTWRFISITDRSIIRQICREAMRPFIPNRWLEQVPLVIVGCSQLDIITNRVGAKISGIEYYQIDIGIAMEHMVLKATDLGLVTCWIGWFSEEKVKSILDIPNKIKVSALLAVGYPKDGAAAKRNRKPMKQILFSEKWGNQL